MRRNLTLILATILLASGTSLIGCSKSNAIPDETPAETPRYRSTEEGTSEASGDIEAAQDIGSSDSAMGVHAVGPVATVNGTDISAEAFNEQTEQLQAAGQLPPELIAHLQSQIIEELINRQLIMDAIEAADIQVTPEQIEERLAKFRQEFSEEDLSFDDLVAEMGMSEDEMRELVRETVAIESLLEQRGMQSPSQEEVRAYYDANPEYFARPETVEARHILLRVEDDSEEAWEEARQRAEEIRAQITEEGADFAQMAQEHSDDGSAMNGGALGPLPRGVTVPEFEEALFSLEPSEISEPVRTEFGWHIIQVEDRHEEGALEFSEVEDQLARELENQAAQEALDDLLVSLRQSATIEIHAENIR